MENFDSRADKRSSVAVDTSGYASRSGEKYIFVFVGLPARGKSYLSRKLAKYLDWMGFDSKVFSIGLYRRTLIGVNCDWKFFDDKRTENLREKCFMKVVEDMISFLLNGGRVGIIDGTNTRREARKKIEEYVVSHIPSNVKYNFMWIESICDLEDVIEKNIVGNKLKSPDYRDWPEENAIKDFRDRINTYQKTYEHLSPELDGENSTYIQLINYNTEIVIRNVNGFLQSKVLSFLVNLIPGENPIYFTRHGGSENDLKNIRGGDSGLNDTGRSYAQALYKFLSNEEYIKNGSKKFNIYCSTLKRSLHTAQELSALGKLHPFKCLDDLNLGVCDGMSNEEIKEKYPKEFEEREKDKLNHSYPRGESYRDLIHRIEPLIYELERRQGPVIVVGHHTTLRCLYGYFTHTPLENIPKIDIPFHTVLRKLPQAFGFNEERFHIDLSTGEVRPVKLEVLTNYEDNLYNVPEKTDL